LCLRSDLSKYGFGLDRLIEFFIFESVVDVFPRRNKTLIFLPSIFFTDPQVSRIACLRSKLLGCECTRTRKKKLDLALHCKVLLGCKRKSTLNVDLGILLDMLFGELCWMFPEHTSLEFFSILCS
jgi:hypothetical protein